MQEIRKYIVVEFKLSNKQFHYYNFEHYKNLIEWAYKTKKNRKCITVGIFETTQEAERFIKEQQTNVDGYSYLLDMNGDITIL